MARGGIVTRPFRARYGNRDKGHDLLAWDGRPMVPPSALLGLTDRPPKATGPDAHWWPSVGCGPIDNVWALWWTVPDFEADRGGMVRSEVAVWRLDDIGNVDDLRPILQSINGDKPISVPSPDLMAAVVDVLLSENRFPPVLLDLELWPGVIAALWSRLWPEARRAFSARVAFTPPQSSESVSPPWLYGVPARQALAWSQHRQIMTTTNGVQLSRAGQWLTGVDDATFIEIFHAAPIRPSSLEKLTTIARAADRLDQLRTNASLENGRDLLRVLALLAPKDDAGTAIKAEAVNVLQRDFAQASWKFVVSLGSLDVAHIPNARVISDAFQAWIARHAHELSREEATRMLTALGPDQTQPWWQDAVKTSLSIALADPKPSWAKAALQWLSLSDANQALDVLLPSTAIVEQRLFESFSQTGFDRSRLEILRDQVVKRHWSRLHALIVQALLPADEAFRAQWEFPTDALAGMAVLVERLPGTVVVEEALAIEEPSVFSLLAKRTAREPGLLQSLGASVAAWRALWAAHIAAGGAHWPPGVNRSAAARGLLDAAIAGDDVDKLVVALAEGLAVEALDHPNRPTLWARLGRMACEKLLNHVANALIARCDNGYDIPQPEDPLRNAAVAVVRSTRPSARMIVTLLRWNVRVSEDELIAWLNGPRSSDWALVAPELGAAVNKRQWSRAAKAIYDRASYSETLRSAAIACRELLSAWERFMISWWTEPLLGRTSYQTILVERVAEIGANLCPEGLDDLWWRAGGERKQLPTWGTPAMRWREAANLAHNGALRGGLAPLVAQLKSDFQHSPQLQELTKVLDTRR